MSSRANCPIRECLFRAATAPHVANVVNHGVGSAWERGRTRLDGVKTVFLSVGWAGRMYTIRFRWRWLKRSTAKPCAFFRYCVFNELQTSIFEGSSGRSLFGWFWALTSATVCGKHSLAFLRVFNQVKAERAVHFRDDGATAYPLRRAWRLQGQDAVRSGLVISTHGPVMIKFLVVRPRVDFANTAIGMNY